LAKGSIEVVRRPASKEDGAAVGRGSAWSRYAAFLRTPPELTLAWSDAPTSARAWLVINSARGGAAGGGTRMRNGLRVREVTYLAKAMELKFALSGPSIGGAKCGIDFDPTDPARTEVLERFYHAIEPLLRHRYGTGGDLNVDETIDVIPAFRRIGLHHPQEGVVRGHFRPDEAGYHAIMDRLETGITIPVDDALGITGLPLSVSDMVTGYGVARAIERLLERQGRALEGARVLLEGFGNVGASCALYLARSGARIVAIRDARNVLRDPDGVSAADMEQLIRDRRNKMLRPSDPRVVPGSDDAFFRDADVFVCAAISESVLPATLDRLEHHGVHTIACGANQPFRESKIGSTRVARSADRRFSVLADIVSNCGMARALSYLMERDARVEPGAIFEAVNGTICSALDEALERNGNRATTLLAATLEIALDRVMSPHR
jgi:glutamate dehydrogenase/leucine dehydrogenase